MTLRFSRLEFGALAVAALAAVYGIWLAVGLPPLPLGIHVGRSPIEAPNVVQLANGPLRGTQPTVRPLATTLGRPGRLEVGTALSSRFATAPARKRTVSPGPAAPAPAAPTPQGRTVRDSIHPALALVASATTTPLPLTTPLTPTTPLPPVTVPAVTPPALPSTPPAPTLPQTPQAPQAPSPPPQVPGLPPLP